MDLRHDPIPSLIHQLAAPTSISAFLPHYSVVDNGYAGRLSKIVLAAGIVGVLRGHRQRMDMTVASADVVSFSDQAIIGEATNEI